MVIVVVSVNSVVLFAAHLTLSYSGFVIVCLVFVMCFAVYVFGLFGLLSVVAFC